jgi:hypothetical protein
MSEPLESASSPSALTSSPKRPGRSRRASWQIFGFVVVATLINQRYVTSELDWETTLVTLLYAGYVTAAILIGLGIIAGLQRKPLLPVPLLSRFCAKESAYATLAVAVVLFTLARERGCGIRVTYEVMQTHSRGAYSAREQLTVTGPGGALQLSGLPMRCTAHCDEATAVCSAAIDGLCPELPPSEEAHLVTAFDLEVEDPFCYFPLIKSNQVAFHARASFVRAGEAGAKTALDLDVQGTATMVATGPMSCRYFRRAIGFEVRQQLMMAVNEQLARH